MPDKYKNIQIRVTDDERRKLDKLAESMGLNVAALTRMFYKKLLTEKKLPFDV